MKKLTKEQIKMVQIEVTKEFQKFGYTAEVASVDTDEKSTGIVFKSETPTGMAAFSQKSIQCSAEIYSSRTVQLGIRYEHVGGGSNGYSVDYIVIVEDESFNRTKVSLVSRTVYYQIMEDQRKRMEENKKETK